MKYSIGTKMENEHKSETGKDIDILLMFNFMRQPENKEQRRETVCETTERDCKNS